MRSIAVYTDITEIKRAEEEVREAKRELEVCEPRLAPSVQCLAWRHHAEPSLVKDVIAAEEQEPMQVKGLSRPIRNYRVRIDSAEPMTARADDGTHHPRGAYRLQAVP